MNPFDDLFPIALGTNRFHIQGVHDEEGLENSTQIVLRAIERGINYIDVAPGYSNGAAYDVLRRAFTRTKTPLHITLKARSDIDRTADDVLRRAELSLEAMGISSAAHFLAWSIFSYDEFMRIMAKGGMYDGILKLKDEKLIKHICFSTHAPVPDIIKILNSGAFEGVTISYSLLNSTIMQDVLDAALALNIGVAAMNPLGGGVIPANREYFSFVRNNAEKSTPLSALRFVKAQEAINIVISGVSSLEELDENLSAIYEPDVEGDAERIKRVSTHLRTLKNFCTGCNYCSGCPMGIPVSAYMQSYNTLLFEPAASYHRTEFELLRNIQLFKKLFMNFNIIPDSPKNPCVRCGRCEAKCTQKLKIIDALEDIFKRANLSAFSREARKNRLADLLNNSAYRTICFYPSGGYFAWISSMYRSLFGEPQFELLLCNSDPKTWGTRQDGLIVHSPDDIAALSPDAILVCNYNYSEEIYSTVRKYEQHGIAVKKLHNNDDVPWLF